MRWMSVGWCVLLVACSEAKPAEQPVVITKETPQGELRVDFNPAAHGLSVSFAGRPVEAGKETTVSVLLSNVGDGRLRIHELGFAYRAPDGAVEPVGPALALREVRVRNKKTMAWPSGLDLAPGAPPIEVIVAFHRYDDGLPRSAALAIRSDTKGDAKHQLVRFTAPAYSPPAVVLPPPPAPCIEVEPGKIAFGGKLVGTKSMRSVTIRSCGDAPLEVTDVALGESSPDFWIDEWEPATVAPGDEIAVPIFFVPDVDCTTTAEGQPILDRGTLFVDSNAGPAEAELSGFGVNQGCPTPYFILQEGEQVTPQTTLHLYGPELMGCVPVATWHWSVDQPVGSTSSFVPSALVRTPTFEANVSGAYRFRLDTWDVSGVKSCVPAEVEVLVVPAQAIHVELLWHTPGDSDETDVYPAVGSDMDLHFVHDAYAANGPDLDQDGQPDGWFDQPFDCFWYNAHPNWGTFDPATDDDPHLDRDDTDGAGPETLSLDGPENTRYRIGIHYWSDKDLGPSWVTLRAYIYGVLVFEMNDVMLVAQDMWNAATIDWPSGKVTAVEKDGGLWITPKYVHPTFYQP